MRRASFRAEFAAAHAAGLHSVPHARGLLRRCTVEQLIHARIQPAAQPGSTAQISWKQRMHALIASNPRAVIESCPQELFTAAGCPETVTTTARMIQSRAAT